MGKQSAEHRAERIAECRHRSARYAHRSPSLFGRKQSCYQREVVGHDKRAAGGLERTKEDQLFGTLRPSCSQSTGCIENKTGAEYFSDSDKIRQASAG